MSGPEGSATGYVELLGRAEDLALRVREDTSRCASRSQSRSQRMARAARAAGGQINELTFFCKTFCKILEGSLSDVTKPIIESKKAFCKMFQLLQDTRTFAALQIKFL